MGDGSLSVEFLEVGLDGGWLLVWIRNTVMGRKTYLRSQLRRVCLLAQSTSSVQGNNCVGFTNVDDW